MSSSNKVHDYDEDATKASKTTLEKALIAVSVILSLAVIGLVIGIVIVATEQPPTATAPPVCETETCVERSAWIMKAIDTTVKPCDDFYMYACGRWVKETEMPSDKSRIGTFDGISDSVNKMLNTSLTNRRVNAANPNTHAADKAAFAYQQCLQSDSVQSEAQIAGALLRIVNNVGGCSLLSPSWPPANFNKGLFMANVQAITRDSFIYTGVFSDLKDSSRNRITIQQPYLNLPVKDNFADTTKEPYVTYRQFVIDVFTALANYTKPPSSNAAFVQEIDEMLTLERLIANATFHPDEIRDESKTYKLVDYGNLQPIYREIIGNMATTLVAATVDSAEKIQVIVGEKFLENYEPILSSASTVALANFGIWCMIRNELFAGMPPRIRNMEISLYQKLRGSNPPARWSSCLSLWNNYLAFGVGRLYVDEHLDKQIKNDLLAQIDYISEEFLEESLQSNTWIDDATRKEAIAKLNAMGHEVAYPDFILDDNALNSFYTDIMFSSSALFIDILERATHGTTVRLMNDWVKRVADRKAWHTGPQTVNAFYSPSANSIYFPGGILYPPFYHRDLPKSMNFGGIGYVIGHEISHGFDDQGRQYDKDGNMQNWWTESSIAAFDVRAKCMIDQYSSCCFDTSAGKQCVNGNFTQGENIADNGGLRTSYEAYRKWKLTTVDAKLPGLQSFTDEQLFFLTSAHVWCLKQTEQRLLSQLQTDPHSPMPYRVNVQLQNLEQFSEVWQCGPDTFMNPKHKCRVW